MLRGPIPSNPTAGDVTRAACNVTSHLTRHTSSISRQVFARVMQEPVRLERKEGAGKAGCPRHPRPRTPLRVRVKRNATGPDRTAASLRNGFNGLLRALPGDRALVATVALAHGLPLAKAQRPLQSARTTRLGRPRAIVTATSTGQCRSLSEDVLRRSSARRLVRLRTRPAHEPAPPRTRPARPTLSRPPHSIPRL